MPQRFWSEQLEGLSFPATGMRKTLWKNRFWGGSVSGYRCWLCLLDTQMDWMSRHLDPWVWSSKTGSRWIFSRGLRSTGIEWDRQGSGAYGEELGPGPFSKRNYWRPRGAGRGKREGMVMRRRKTARCDALETNWVKCSKEEEGSSHIQCYAGQALSTGDSIQPRGCPGDFDKSTFGGAIESSLD